MSRSILTQYTMWPYPDATGSDAITVAPSLEAYNLANDQAIIWPDRPYRSKLNVLVAGCGTLEAFAVAHSNPEMQVTGIDISASSLDHAKYFARQHHLSNLELLELDLRHAATLARKFDLVICSGVLHHLPDPQDALMALGSVLEDDGALLLSVYRRHSRLGVYMIQDALRHLEVGHGQGEVDFARNVLALLWPGHPLFANTPRDAILQGSDTDIVDTFLNSHDRPFTVGEVLDLVQQAGLSFQCWLDNSEYYPDAHIAATSALGQRLQARPRNEQWAVVELLCGIPGRHRLVVKKTIAQVTDIDELLSTDKALDLKAGLRSDVRITGVASKHPELRRQWLRMELTQTQAAIVLQMDGSKRLRDLAGMQDPQNAMGASVLSFVRTLWRCGYLIVYT